MGSMFLITGLLILPVRMIKNNITLLALQSLFLSLIAFLLGSKLGFNGQIIFIGFLTLVVKVFVLPFILLRLAKQLKADKELHPNAGPVVSIVAGISLAVLTYDYVVPVMLQDITSGEELLAAAISTILFGCFYVVSRRSVLNQVIGVIMMENGLFLSALAITGGMPLIIELGIFFDILVGVLVMGAMIYKISDRFQTLDIKKLNRLRG
jgi:hydrogenase-4 component E